MTSCRRKLNSTEWILISRNSAGKLWWMEQSYQVIQWYRFSYRYNKTFYLHLGMQPCMQHIHHGT